MCENEMNEQPDSKIIANRTRSTRFYFLVSVQAFVTFVFIAFLVFIFQFSVRWRPEFLNSFSASVFSILILVTISAALLWGMIAGAIGPVVGKRVFVSYSSRDKNIADQLILNLRKHGVDVIDIDQELKVGDVIRSKIPRILSECSHVIVLVGTGYEDSGWQQFEMKSINSHSKVIPLLVGREESPESLKDIYSMKVEDVNEQLLLELLSILPRKSISSAAIDIALSK